MLDVVETFAIARDSEAAELPTRIMTVGKPLNVGPSRADEQAVNEKLAAVREHEVHVVALAMSDDERASRLSNVLAGLECEVLVIEQIESVIDVVGDDRPFIVIVDDEQDSWLRKVSDLVHRRPNARPLAFGHIESPEGMLAAVNAGVAGFVPPGADDVAIARTIRAVIDGGVAIPRGLVATLVEEVRRGRGRSMQTADGQQVELTEREWQIVQLLLQRRTTREIAEKLYVSVGTVRSHISALGRKLGAEDRRDLVRSLEAHRG